MTEVSGLKQRGGRQWKPGESGNLSGRPKGSGLAGEIRKAIANNAPAIVARLTEQALAGDTAAARALLDRVLPSAKSETLPVEFPGLADGSLAQRAEAVLRAAGSGAVSPDIAAGLIAVVGALSKIRETDELESRIRALEERDEKK